MLRKESPSSACSSSLCDAESLDVDYSMYVQNCQAKECTYRISGSASATESIGQVSHISCTRNLPCIVFKFDSN